jgi:hypothetical protein
LVLALFNVVIPLIIHLEARHGGHGIAFLAIDWHHVLFAAVLLTPEDMPMDWCLFLRRAHHPFLPEIITCLLLEKIAYNLSVAVANSSVEAHQPLQQVRFMREISEEVASGE